MNDYIFIPEFIDPTTIELVRRYMDNRDRFGTIKQ